MLLGARTTGGIALVTMSSQGRSYDAQPSVTFSGGGGAGAAGVAIMNGTVVRGIQITNAGTGYSSNPTVSIAAQSVAVTVSEVTAATSSATITVSTAVATTYAAADVGSGIVPVTFTSNTQFTVGTTAASTGARTLYRGGTGAAATAYAYTGSLRPITFFKGRYSDVYGVDGMGRGFRWNGDDASVEQIGLAQPAVGPAVTATLGTAGDYVKSVLIVNGGNGYTNAPTVTFNGGSPTKTAKGRAVLVSGRVAGVTVTDPGAGYQTPPRISFSGGIGTAPSFNVGVIGSVDAVSLTARGFGYTTVAAVTGTTDVIHLVNHGLSAGSTVQFTQLSGGTALALNTVYYAVTVAGSTLTLGAASTAATTFGTAITRGRMLIPEPRVVFSTAQGLTDAVATVTIGSNGQLTVPTLLSGGTGATAAVTASITGGAGSGAAMRVTMKYAVDSVTAATSGANFFTSPFLTFRAATGDPSGSGAAATVLTNTTGQITGVTVAAGGEYSLPPTALIIDTSAQATAEMATRMAGKYRCAIRYVDDTPVSPNGPIPSSISELVEIDCGDGASAITWNFTHPHLDARVHAMELWRTTADQAVMLFRIATILRSEAAFTGSYTDTLTDADLKDTKRANYGIMPVTLPSGQVNARRFEVPPGNMAVACMFQDRAWYAVDATGRAPNSLLYSELDEPESVPPSNELVLQENTRHTDTIVALIPLAGYLLIVQRAHLYKLSYVAQPVLDASVLLSAYRGALHNRSWDVLGGVAFIVDTQGMYAFDGQNEEAVSVPVDDFWRNNIIDFSKADKFHVKADTETRTVRFYYCRSGDSEPVRALCYCVATQAWWEETYPTAITAAAPIFSAGRYGSLVCTAGGTLAKSGGMSDLDGAGIAYDYQGGNYPLTTEDGSRTIRVLYSPTVNTSQLRLRLHYNNSATPRPNAISSDRGERFVAGATDSTLDMKKTLSLGDANGNAVAYYSGRVDDRSANGDKHLAVGVAGTQNVTSGDSIVLYSVNVEGAG